MEWWAYLTIILAVLTVFFLSGLPIAFCFTLFNFIAVYFWMGGVDGFALLTRVGVLQHRVVSRWSRCRCSS